MGDSYGFSRSPFNYMRFLLAGICILSFTFFSCSPAKVPVYFSTLPRDTTLRNIVTENYDIKIQKNDVLGISVASLSPDVAFYNAGTSQGPSQGSSQSAGGISSSAGYSIDSDGNISFIKIGVVHALGLTRKQLKDTLEKALVPYLKDVVVTVSFLNRHITMLGAISAQVLPMPGDNMTIFDALAASGDIVEKGKLDNVLVIREQHGAKTFKRLNLKDQSVFYSPYYYMQPNDIVYVEPVKVKTPITTPQIIGYVTTAISLIILILNSVKF